MKLYRKWLRRFTPPALLNRINSLSHIEDRLFDLEARRAQLAGIVLREHYANLLPPVPAPSFRCSRKTAKTASSCGFSRKPAHR